MKQRHVTALAGLLLLSPALGLAQGPLGSEFRVNAYTTAEQNVASVTADPSGNFVAVWTSGDQDGQAGGIFGQRYDRHGTTIGSEFQVNSFTTGGQFSPDVASFNDGSFVVVWSNNNDIAVQRFNSAGSPLGTEFQANTFVSGFQGSPGVVTSPAGNFVVVWSSYPGQDGSNFGVFGRRFSTTGAPLSGEFQVNTYTTGQQAFQHRGTIDTDANGNFVVVWQSFSGQDGSSYGVFGQRFNSAGAAIGTEFQANSYTTGIQKNADVAVAADGSFAVVWGDTGQDGSGYGVFGHRFDSAGNPTGTEFQVNTYTYAQQTFGKLAGADNGSFVVVWHSYSQDGSQTGVFGQRYDRLGAAAGTEFQINTYTTGYQELATVAPTSAAGAFVVAWTDGSYDVDGQDASLAGVYAQRFSQPLDHYKCYQGKDLKNPKFNKLTGVATTDQITGAPVDVSKIKYVCTPVNKNGEGINDLDSHLICYQVKGPSLAPRPHVEVSTQFQTSQFELKKPKLLCLPGTKTVIP